MKQNIFFVLFVFSLVVSALQ